MLDGLKPDFCPRSDRDFVRALGAFLHLNSVFGFFRPISVHLEVKIYTNCLLLSNRLNFKQNQRWNRSQRFQRWNRP